MQLKNLDITLMKLLHLQPAKNAMRKSLKRICISWSEERKVRLLGPMEHEKYAYYILPKTSSALSFEKKNLLLSKTFSERS